MTSEEFAVVFDEQQDRCWNLLLSKAGEYATEDRLHNFKVAAALQGMSPIEALAGMMSKHVVSIYDMCGSSGDKSYPLELWDEKITDNINYLILLSALVREDAAERALE